MRRRSARARRSASATSTSRAGSTRGPAGRPGTPDGSFVSLYVAESRAAREIPVFTYYQLLQSKPGGGDEAHADLANLRDADTMHAYWADLETFFRRAAGPKPVVLHVEPDLWGYIEQASTGDDAASVPAVVPDGLPQTAAGFAQEFVRMRDRLAPNVILAWHMSGWGTGHDIAIEDPPDRTVVAYATRSAAFYRSLDAAFDLSFEDFSDRDAGFYEKVEHVSTAWFTAADFHRHLLYGRTFVRLAGIRMAAWQIPLGNTRMRAMDDTTGHYQDNRVQWLLDGAHGRAHLRAYVRAGYVGFLFGGGAGGTTCACDGQKDGVTNPPPIGKNTRDVGLRRRRRRLLPSLRARLHAARSAAPADHARPSYHQIRAIDCAVSIADASMVRRRCPSRRPSSGASSQSCAPAR